MKKEGLFVLFSILLGAVIFIAVAFSVDLSKVLQTLQLISISDFAVLFGLYAVIFLISLARWGMTLSAFGYNISFKKLLSFRLSEWACSYITPFSRLGGEPVMAYLFKKESKIKYRRGISVIILNKVFDFASALVLVLIGLILLIANYWDFITGKMLIFIIAAIFILVILVYLFYVKTIKKEGFFTMMLKPFRKIIPHKSLHENIKIVEHELAEFFRKNTKRVIALGIISLIFQLLVLVEYKLIGLFLGVNLSIVHILVINIFLVLSFMIPIPGSLGGMEGMLAFVFGLLGFGASKGFAFSLTLRLLEVIVMLIGLVVTYYYGIKSFKKVIDENI